LRLSKLRQKTNIHIILFEENNNNNRKHHPLDKTSSCNKQQEFKKEKNMSAAAGKTYLITGANRGIGFYLTKKLLSDNARVIATARNPAAADELRALDNAQTNLTVEGS